VSPPLKPGTVTDAMHDRSSGSAGMNTRTVGDSSRNEPQVVLPADSVPVGDRDLEDILTDIISFQQQILDNWHAAVEIFNNKMTSASHKEASADFQKSIVNYVANTLIDRVVAKVPEGVPGLKEAVGLIKGLADETHRAAVAGASAKLADFVNKQIKMVVSLKSWITKNQGGAISAAKELQKGFDASTSSHAPAAKKGGAVALDTGDAQFKWAVASEGLQGLLRAVTAVFNQSTPESLFKVISGEWLSQSQASLNALGATDASWIAIRLNEDYSVKDVHIHGPGGQKIAEQLLEDSPNGVDVWAIKTRRSVVHTTSGGWNATLFVDANNHDATPPAGRNKETEELYKYVMAHGVGLVKNIDGD